MRSRPTVSDDTRAAHLAALRLIGFHGGSFAHNCDAATCTRAAHWRYFPEQNPILARLAIPCGAYEVYEVAAADGYPAGAGFALLRLSEGPAGRWYTTAALCSTYGEAVRTAFQFAVPLMEAEFTNG